jgi:hypothetical protein
MRNRLTKRERRERQINPLFTDDRPVAARLMRPGPLTRLADRVVDYTSRFEADVPERPFILADPSESQSPRRLLLGFGIATVAYSILGVREHAALFFGTQALMLVGLKKWFDWHRAHPPASTPGSTRGRIVSALMHAAGAFAVGIFYLYVLDRAIPTLGREGDWLTHLSGRMLPPGLAVITYQRRAGWVHDDPERMIIIVVVTAAFAGLSVIAKTFLFGG